MVSTEFRYGAIGQASMAILASACLLGCGGESFELAPVGGVVTLDGQPLARARVAFQPRRGGDSINAGPGSYGTTDAQGRFQLETIEGQPGGVVGDHEVSIATYQAEPDPQTGRMVTQTPEKVPAHYAEPGALTFQVPPEGTDAAEFHLTTAPHGE